MGKRSIPAFRRKVLSYYSKHGRDLPWRRTEDPYKILLSEVMLQQTQVDRVIPYYEEFTKRWPTVERLAGASRRDVLAAWMGLGYNSRGINLHEAARTITARYRRDVLKAVEDYKNIRGVGPYTSAAVRIFAANKDIVTVDTNIRRILIHEFNRKEDISEEELYELAKKCLPKGKSRDWHNALMDYGATLLTARKTGIRPRSRQSRFEGSDRQIRARILREAIKQPTSMQMVLGFAEQDRVMRIIDKMIKEDIIAKRGERLSLKENRAQ